jgi:carboxypeptidase Q
MFDKNFTKIISVIIILLIASSFQQADDELSIVFRRISHECLAHSQAYPTLSKATKTIGHRLTGTTNGNKAEEYTHHLLEKYGFKSHVKFMPFEVEAWARDTVSLAIVPSNSDNFQAIKTVSLAHSPVSAATKGEIIDCNNGLESDFEALGEQVKGKIALINIGISPANPALKNLHRSEKTALAIRYGAIGVIIANQVKGGVLLTGTASVTGSLIPIPAVCISLEDGISIREVLKTEYKLQAHIAMRNKSNVIKARNVVATLKGHSLPNEKIIIGGHLDSWDLATGATDNGLGAFTIIEIARIFKALNLKPKRSIEFVLFMGEEQGLLGSEAMVQRMIKNKSIGQVRYMINLDMTTNSIGFNAGGRDEMLTFFAKTGEKIRAIDTVYQNKIQYAMGLHSDHQSFMLEGIPVAAPVGNPNPAMFQCYHADCDDIRWADKKYMDNCARFTAMMLFALANADDIPAKRLDNLQTRQFLIKQGLKKELQIGNDWRYSD